MQCYRTAPYTALVIKWNKASTTSLQFWLTRRGIMEVHRIWHLLLVTMCHFVHWNRQTNCCLAVFTHLSSCLTKHFLLVVQCSGMTCLLTVMLQFVWTVLSVINANCSAERMLITSSNSPLSRLWLRVCLVQLACYKFVLYLYFYGM